MREAIKRPSEAIEDSSCAWTRGRGHTDLRGACEQLVGRKPTVFITVPRAEQVVRSDQVLVQLGTDARRECAQ